ncbi:MAG TPA: dienelactone hydrolase family protein, partial [Myxococcota bacterium]|nr:dienelactone hydrolase family protein [Myxococcota bacterium]
AGPPGVDLRLIVYPGVLHGFTVPDADDNARAFGMPLGYDARADRASWAALLTLLAEVMDG